VTAAFGKAAYKWAGDFARQRQIEAQQRCGSSASCPEADLWADGKPYRSALHMAIGSLAFGSAGAAGNLAGSLALNAMDKALADLGITDPAAVDLLKNAAATMAGAAADGTAGAAAAFNADANNRQLHADQADAVKRRARELAGVDGKSAYEWEVALTQQLLRQNDATYAGFSENAQARTVLAALQASTGVSMSAEGTAEYWNPSINANQLALNAASYIAAGNLPQLHRKADLLTHAYANAVNSEGFAELPLEQQRQVLGQLIVYSEALANDPKASAIQRRMADAAARTAAAWVRKTGAMPADMPLVNAERRLGQSYTEEMLGAAIAGALHRGKLLETEAARLASQAPTVTGVGVEWGAGIKEQGDPWERRVGEAKPVDAKLPDGFPTFDYFVVTTGTAISAKTLNTMTPARVSDPDQVYYKAKQHIDKVADFEYAERAGTEIKRQDIRVSEVELLVPAQTTRVQWEAFQRADEYGRSRKVVVKITKGNWRDAPRN
jgi:hypothetical protein